MGLTKEGWDHIFAHANNACVFCSANQTSMMLEYEDTAYHLKMEITYESKEQQAKQTTDSSN